MGGTANDKTYDGTTAGSGALSLNGVLSGDDVQATATFTFADRNAGVGKTVSLSNGALAGADAGNYVLMSIPATLMADILRRAISATASANDKTYDGTTAATGSLTLNGVLGNDDVTGSATFTFADKNAGADRTVSLSNGVLAGNDAGNYTLTLPTTTLADILRRAISATASANDKTYDGTTAATGSLTLNGVLGNDDVTGSATFTFADKNAGTDRTVSLSNGVLAGNDAGNYVLTLPTTTLADILRRAVSVTANANDKTYDGTTAATGSLTLNGVLGNDEVTGSATFAFADRNAGLDKTVSVTNGVLAGNDAGNYTLTLSATTLADIFRRAITITAQDAAKTEGQQDPVLHYAVTNGALVQGDVFTGALSRAPGEAPGVYTIGQGDLAASSNYQLTFNGAQLTIEPADAQAPANPIFDSFLISIGNPVVPVEKAIALVVENLDCEDSDCPVSEQ
ncbi:MAG: hypothetical protein A2352_10205 [Caulobacterales bacterium RIFOXYB1_FULL_67_16]|nr:MAG: hypothetical protein A2352_10205 [Caulobacterales bacterium RIFOXYB1_FULL_67_16]